MSIFQNYSPKIIDMFEILGCYFVDIYYNHIYISAKNRFKQQGPNGSESLTEEYKNSIFAYMKAIKNDKRCYLKTIQGLHTYFQNTTRFSTISLSEFIYKLVNLFVPEEHHSLMSEKDRDFFLNFIITNMTTEFGAIILQNDKLKMVIDDHTNRNNITLWTAEIVNVQILEKEKIFTHFVNKISQRSDKIPIEVVNGLKNNFGKVLKEKCFYENKSNKLSDYVKILLQNIKTKDKKINDLANDINKLQNKLLSTKQELFNLKNNKILNMSENDKYKIINNAPNSVDNIVDNIVDEIYDTS